MTSGSGEASMHEKMVTEDQLMSAVPFHQVRRVGDLKSTTFTDTIVDPRKYLKMCSH